MNAMGKSDQQSLLGLTASTDESLQGTVETISYRASDSSFTVAKLLLDDAADTITIVGDLFSVNRGDIVICYGGWVTHKQFGRQFHVGHIERVRPNSIESIEKFLANGSIKGFGKATAKRIVETFGSDTLDIIEKDPDRLREVPGLGTNRVEKLIHSWREQAQLRHTLLRLQSLGISPTNAARIFRTYDTDSIRIVEGNPYQLTYDIWGIGFKTADQIAQQIGFTQEDPRRIDAGVVHVLNEAVVRGGNTYVLREELIASAGQILESPVANPAIERLVRSGQIVVEPYLLMGHRQDAVYPPTLYRNEVDVANHVRRICSGKVLEFDVPVDPSAIDIGGSLTEEQHDAVVSALKCPFLIVTGGPGVGKTTTTRAIVTAFEARNKQVLLASPTGRAARRLFEVTGREARTIHRLLEYDQQTRGFRRNAHNPLSCDLLVIDEASMLDISLISSLLAAVPDGCHVILIGDVDQLPSVGPGNVLRDMIDSGVVKVGRLTRIFRQVETSRIITNAHRINHGDMPVLSGPADGEDFVFIEANEPGEAAAKTVAIVSRSLPNRGYKPEEIQVLTPMQRGEAGAIILNLRLQSALNPETSGVVSLTRAGRTFREGDRVMQIVNNYDVGVFNGDIGTIKSINEADEVVVVSMSEGDVCYDFKGLDELVLAYASTIHKSQGSEFPVIVVLVQMQHSILLQRNLIYTALTRARKLAVFVGSKRAIGFAVRTQSEVKRNTRLKYRLQGLIQSQIGHP